jgi:hypothetical protein
MTTLAALELLFTSDVSNAVAGTQQLAASLADTERAVTSSSAGIDSANQKTVQSTQQAAAAVEQAEKKLSTAFVAMGAAAVAGLGLMTKSTLDLASNVRTLQRITGDTAEATSSLIFAGQQMGVSVDAMSTSFGIFEKHLVNADSVVQKYGLSLYNADGTQKSFSQVLEETATMFAALPSAAAQSTAAMELFGRSGKTMLPLLTQGAEGLRTLTAEAEQYGVVMSQSQVDAAKAVTAGMRDLSAAWKGFLITMGTEALPAIRMVTAGLTDFVMWLSQVPGPIRVAVLGVMAFVGALGLVAKAVSPIASTMQSAITVFEAWGKRAAAAAAAAAPAAEGVAATAAKAAASTSTLSSALAVAGPVALGAAVAYAAVVIASNAMASAQDKLNAIQGAGVSAAQGVIASGGSVAAAQQASAAASKEAAVAYAESFTSFKSGIPVLDTGVAMMKTLGAAAAGTVPPVSGLAQAFEAVDANLLSGSGTIADNIKLLQSQGLSYQQATSYVEFHAEALATSAVNQQMAAGAAQNLVQQYAAGGMSASEMAAKVSQLNSTFGGALPATLSTVQGVQAAADAYNEAAAAAMTTAQATQMFQQATMGAAAAQLGIVGAHLAVKQAQLNLNQAVKDYGPNSLQAKQATLALQQAQMGMVNANRQATSSVQQVKQAIADGAMTTKQAAAEYQRLGQQGVISSGQVKTLIAALHSTPKITTATIKVLGLSSLSDIKAIGSALASLVGTYVANIVTNISGGIAGRAGGGPVEAGKPYIVGEHRPELFVPSVPGRIEPRVPAAAGASSERRAAASGPRTVVNLHVNGSEDPQKLAATLSRYLAGELSGGD